MRKDKSWILNSIETETNYCGPGVYRGRLIVDGSPTQIKRLGGTDYEGILFIGQSKNIEKRRKAFIRATSGHHGHSEGIQWFLVGQFSNLDNLSDLWFEYARVTTEKEAKKREANEIWGYFKRFLEAPPLNGCIPEREKRFDKIRSQS